MDLDSTMKIVESESEDYFDDLLFIIGLEEDQGKPFKPSIKGVKR